MSAYRERAEQQRVTVPVPAWSKLRLACEAVRDWSNEHVYGLTMTALLLLSVLALAWLITTLCSYDERSKTAPCEELGGREMQDLPARCLKYWRDKP